MTSQVSTDRLPLISVILPVFNVACYIQECLESILQQDFRQAYEVILVDDASTDGSIDSCRQYTADYPEKIKLIECELNSGVSVARNLGLEQARGKYLMFVDPDDILPPSALSILFNAAEQYNADIVKGNLVLFDDNRQRPAPDEIKRLVVIEGEDVLATLFEHIRVRGHIGGKMYRHDKFCDIRFHIGVRMAQDLLYFSEIFSIAHSLVLLNQEVYYYRKHQAGSTGRKYEKGSYIDWLSAVEDAGKFASSYKQKRAHKDLLVRTMTQIARECRNIPEASAARVLETIEQKCRQWNMRFFHLIVRDKLGLRSISRYIKLQLALKQIRRSLSRT